MSGTRTKFVLLGVNALLVMLLFAVAPRLQASSASFGCCRVNVAGDGFCCDKNSCDCDDEYNCFGDADCEPLDQ